MRCADVLVDRTGEMETMDRESIAEGRLRFAELPRVERSERMIADIMRGTAKDDSPAVVDEQDGRMWDALARDLEKNSTEGGRIVVYDIDWSGEEGEDDKPSHNRDA